MEENPEDGSLVKSILSGFFLEDPTLSTWHQAVGTLAESCSLTELGCQRLEQLDIETGIPGEDKSHRQVIPSVHLTPKS